MRFHWAVSAAALILALAGCPSFVAPGAGSAAPRASTAYETLTVHSTPIPPPADLHYEFESQRYAQSVAIAPNLPTSTGGAVQSYSVMPPLPFGLSLDGVSGVIRGTPLVVSALGSYVVTASNGAGSASITLSLGVNSAPTTVLGNDSFNLVTGAPSSLREALLWRPQHVEVWTPEQQGWLDWIAMYVPNAPTPSRELLPFLVYDALIVMFSRAEKEITADLGKPDLFEAVQADRTLVAWSHCGNASNFMLRVLDRFHISSRGLSLFHTATDGHSVVEVFSEAFGKYVYFDALYASLLIDPATFRPAGALDIQHAISLGDWASGRIRPYRYGIFTEYSGKAVAPALQELLSYAYEKLMAGYFNYLAIRFEDFSPFEASLPGAVEKIHGRWLLFNNMAFTTELSDAQKRADWQLLQDAYSASSPKGAYFISPALSVPQPTPIPTPTPIPPAQ